MRWSGKKGEREGGRVSEMEGEGGERDGKGQGKVKEGE